MFTATGFSLQWLEVEQRAGWTKGDTDAYICFHWQWIWDNTLGKKTEKTKWMLYCKVGSFHLQLHTHRRTHKHTGWSHELADWVAFLSWRTSQSSVGLTQKTGFSSKDRDPEEPPDLETEPFGFAVTEKITMRYAVDAFLSPHALLNSEWVYLFNKCHQRLEVFRWLAGTREGSAPLGKFMQKVTHKSRQPYNLDSIKIAPVFALRFLFFLNRFPLSTLTKSRASIGERRMCNCFHRRAFTHSHAHTVWSPPEIWMNPADWRGKKTLRWLQ